MNSSELQHLSASTANERSLDRALVRIVEGLANQEGIALARIWLIKPGDLCKSCSFITDCPDQTACLHLVATDGHSQISESVRWNKVGGRFPRFPLGTRKVGRIGSTGEPILLQHFGSTSDWLRDPDWAAKENISSFAGQPLMFRGEILGVIAIFSRVTLTSNDLSLLRTFADNSAAAIANARAFEEIAQLRRQLEQENEYLREEIDSETLRGDIIGKSPALLKILQQVELVARTETTVLIQGESGTGKELIARRIHRQSSRRERPLIKVNCASVPRELFESEFFGHVKGAFTGAVRDRRGRFELADEGTLFLDEVGEIPLELQSKLLRVLQEGTFERVGEEKSTRINVRIIAATNRDLKVEVSAGRFREDLYYRLSVFPIETVPLRIRIDDIPPLAHHFLIIACKNIGVGEMQLKRKHVEAMKQYSWPGNVRELQNVIERAVIVSQGRNLQLDIPGAGSIMQRTEPEPISGIATNELLIQTYDELKKLERQMILSALSEANGKISGQNGAALQLGVHPSTLTSKMAVLSIKRKHQNDFE